jgi:hypothetical protein
MGGTITTLKFEFGWLAEKLAENLGKNGVIKGKEDFSKWVWLDIRQTV